MLGASRFKLMFPSWTTNPKQHFHESPISGWTDTAKCETIGSIQSSDGKIHGLTPAARMLVYGKSGFTQTPKTNIHLASQEMSRVKLAYLQNLRMRLYLRTLPPSRGPDYLQPSPLPRLRGHVTRKGLKDPTVTRSEGVKKPPSSAFLGCTIARHDDRR